jgi:aminoglycoside 6-adenylyltransferase
MMTLILTVAKKLGVKAVALSGSRANPKVPRDSFQDYDIVYVVENKDELLEDRGWLASFGELLIMQTPEEMTLFPPTLGERFTFLMLFKDGNRIDLTLCPLSSVTQWMREEPLFQIISDPENVLLPVSKLSDAVYWTKAPDDAKFQDCCNEFWWVSTYVVKGLARQEEVYAIDHLYGICQQELLRLLSWQVVLEKGALNIGKNYKYLFTHLAKGDQERFQSLLDFSNASTITESLLLTQAFFHEQAQVYAEKTTFYYDKKTAENVIDYTKNSLR